MTGTECVRSSVQNGNKTLSKGWCWRLATTTSHLVRTVYLPLSLSLSCSRSHLPSSFLITLSHITCMITDEQSDRESETDRHGFNRWSQLQLAMTRPEVKCILAVWSRNSHSYSEAVCDIKRYTHVCQARVFFSYFHCCLELHGLKMVNNNSAIASR